jgi:hypothetical protein
MGVRWIGDLGSGSAAMLWAVTALSSATCAKCQRKRNGRREKLPGRREVTARAGVILDIRIFHF